MKKFNALIVILIILIIGILAFYANFFAGIIYVNFIVFLEFFSFLLVRNLRKNFQWLIVPNDEYPELDKNGLDKFMKQGHDKELGWARKPNTEKEEIGKEGKTKYHIDKKGIRKNPEHEKLAKKISCYGDSFVFSRQVNDNETWEWHLSKLTNSNVLNFGVGNYGFDQSLLRLKREYEKNKTKIVIMGVVPSTIVRILCVWKHYSEFGNTFAFKPRFILNNGKLKFIENIVDTKEKFLNYKEFLPEIKKYDYFYKTYFKKEILQFPYSASILADPRRNIPLIFLVSWYKWVKEDNPNQPYPTPMNIIMKLNLKLRRRIFKKDEEAIKLFEKLIEEFIKYSNQKKFTPVFLFMPQKDDILFVKKKPYYDNFINKVKKKLPTIDLTQPLIEAKDLDVLYSDDNKYGGHYSKYGNKFIAEIIFEKLKEEKII